MKATIKTTQTLYAKRWQALVLLCAAQFMVIMDTSIIGVALPAIQQDLGYSSSSLQWIFNAYVILFGGLLLLGGRLSDINGPRKVFLTGFGILTGASLFAGLAWSEASLNIARGLQGVGSALIAPAALTLLMSIFTDPKELGKALGFWGASAAAGGSAGVFLGGVLTEWLSWEWVFYVNIPIGLAVMLASPSTLIKGAVQKGKIDVLGAILGTSSLISAVYAIVTGEQNGWGSVSTISFFAAAVVLFYIFFRSQKRSASPLLPLSIFKAPNLSSSNIVMGLLAAAWIPLWFYLNLYLQQILNFSAFNSGIALLPMTIVIMIFMVFVTGKLIAKFGFKFNLVLGLILLAGSLVWLAAAPVNGNYIMHILGPSVLAALGMSLAYIPATISAMSGAKPQETGLASGIVNTSYQVGSAIGLAIVVAISTAMFNNFSAEVPDKEAIGASFSVAFISASVIAALSGIIAILFIRTSRKANTETIETEANNYSTAA